MRFRAMVFAALAASAFVTFPAAASPAPASIAATAEQRFEHISLVSMGSGKPVVLIPGLASPRAVWDGVAPELAKEHRVILVQVNGFGGDSPGANAQAGILPGAVKELGDYLAANGILKPAVIGHSMGGLLGMMLAKAQPEAVGRLMIVDALPFFGMLMAPGATAETVRPIAEQMRTMIRGAPPATQAPPNMSNSEAGKAQVVKWLVASDPAVTAQALYEDAITDFRPHLPALAGRPVTVLYAVAGAERAALTKGLYEQAYAPLSEARLVPVTDSAHFIMLDQPERFAEEVKAFLR